MASHQKHDLYVLNVFLTIFLSSHSQAILAQATNEQCSTQCQEEDCFIESANCFNDQAEGAKGVEILEKGVKKFPESQDLNLLLVNQYRDLGQDKEAVKILSDFLKRHPENCEVRGRLSWLKIESGENDVALGLLESKEGECQSLPSIRARFLLLKSIFLHKKGRTKEAKDLLQLVEKSEDLCTDDLDLFNYTEELLFQERKPPLFLKINLTNGYSSNIARHDYDLEKEKNVPRPSALSSADFSLRLNPAVNKFIWPFLEARSLNYFLWNKEVKDLSYLEPAARTGFVFNSEYYSFQLEYLYKSRYYQGGDLYKNSSFLYSITKTFNYDLRLYSNILIFGSYGHSQFRNLAKTRLEQDLGMGYTLPFSMAEITLAGMMVNHEAENRAFDLDGKGGMVSLNVPLAKFGLDNYSLLFHGIYNIDDYPHSAEYWEKGKNRRDVFTKMALDAWKPVDTDLRIGLGYGFTLNRSTIDELTNKNHQVLFKIVYVLGQDYSGPMATNKSKAVSWEYNFTKQFRSDEHIRDLFQREETVSSKTTCGASCVTR